MKTQTHLKNTIDAIDSDKAKYDKNVKGFHRKQQQLKKNDDNNEIDNN